MLLYSFYRTIHGLFEFAVPYVGAARFTLLTFTKKSQGLACVWRLNTKRLDMIFETGMAEPQ